MGGWLSKGSNPCTVCFLHNLNTFILFSVYPDVPIAFERLKKAGIPIYIFSSGSIWAQKLLYSHTDYGDLTKVLIKKDL